MYLRIAAVRAGDSPAPRCVGWRRLGSRRGTDRSTVQPKGGLVPAAYDPGDHEERTEGDDEREPGARSRVVGVDDGDSFGLSTPFDVSVV